VQGSTWLATGYGVEGVNEATSGNLATGVYGQTNSPAGGVAVAGTTYGSYYYFPGGAVGTKARRLRLLAMACWVSTAHHGTTAGVYGQSYSNAGYGVYGWGIPVSMPQEITPAFRAKESAGVSADCDRLKQHGSV